MFEATLLPRPAASRFPCTVLTALILQAGAVAAFVLVPLVYPDTLPAFAPARVVPLATYAAQPKPKPVRIERANLTSSATPSAPPHAAVTQSQSQSQPHGGMLSHPPSPSLDPEPAIALGGGIGNLFSLGAGTGPSLTPGPPVSVAAAIPAAPRAALHISSGVSAGLLLEPIRPAYPAIAKAAHVQGTVVLTCTIGKTGRIEGLQVLSGPEILRTSALDAVSLARYKPYKLNGEPTEVITTISVTYRLGDASS